MKWRAYAHLPGGEMYASHPKQTATEAQRCAIQWVMRHGADPKRSGIRVVEVYA